MGEPLRHRQTKEAATDMFSLQPPRHISTLPISAPTLAGSRGGFRGHSFLAGDEGRLISIGPEVIVVATGTGARLCLFRADPHPDSVVAWSLCRASGAVPRSVCRASRSWRQRITPSRGGISG